MKTFALLFSLLLSSVTVVAQTASVRGLLQDADEEPVVFANVALYAAADSSLVKVETTDDNGVFTVRGITAGSYYLSVSYVGAADLTVPTFELREGQSLDLGKVTLEPTAVELEEALVTAERVMVEVKPDRTVFNVQGTVNSAGSDALNLLRKAPGVLVDNNNNISVLGRSGVLVYVDGKRLPLQGEELANYLQNLPAEQIDRFDIITNPGARYEAQGNAGIIDIRLKKDKNLGANGSVTLTGSQGRYSRSNVSTTGNFRSKDVNVFGNVGLYRGANYNRNIFDNRQNQLRVVDNTYSSGDWRGANIKAGLDYFLSKEHTIGVMYNGNLNSRDWSNNTNSTIADLDNMQEVDSLLLASNFDDAENNNHNFNLNYRYDDGKGRTLNVDADYGRYRNDAAALQPNRYVLPDGNNTLLTEVINSFETPTDIDISTFKVDYEQPLLGGKFGVGGKVSRVVTNNTFLFFDVINDDPQQNDDRSNLFDYDERVDAGYVNFSRKLSDKWSFSGGVRVEHTVSTGDLTAFNPELQEPPVELNYTNLFPSAGLTWQLHPKHTVALNYGRRINRPDYQVLNPFEGKLNELTFEKGNPFLVPEIVNNLELSHTFNYRYTTKIGYSRTTDQITRLLSPDSRDPRARFITWENLSEQTVISMNFSAPVQVAPWWNAYFNINGSFLDNQADYGNGAVIDLQTFMYNIFQQHTFNLPKGFKGEISSWYAGPGIWGGTLEFDAQWSFDVGIQKKFLNDQLNARLSASDLFYTSGWSGESTFNGLFFIGQGNWDSRRVSLSLSYNFGNQNVKSRRRQTGLEEESRRIGSQN
jgi:outer membrane receptor protein involved in Fe transport